MSEYKKYKTYKVTGTYHGKATAKVMALSLADAIRKFQNAEEDSLEIEDTSDFQYRESDIVEVGK